MSLLYSCSLAAVIRGAKHEVRGSNYVLNLAAQTSLLEFWGSNFGTRAQLQVNTVIFWPAQTKCLADTSYCQKVLDMEAGA